jgi:hypothetical protein
MAKQGPRISKFGFLKTGLIYQLKDGHLAMYELKSKRNKVELLTKAPVFRIPLRGPRVSDWEKELKFYEPGVVLLKQGMFFTMYKLRGKTLT